MSFLGQGNAVTEESVKQVVIDVVKEVVPAMIEQLSSTSAVSSNSSTQVEYADPYLETLINRKAELMSQPLDIRIIRTKSGIQEVNNTKVAINMINDEINDWKDRKTHRVLR